MSSARQTQNGFSILETLLLIVIAAIIVSSGWYVNRANKNIESSNTKSVKSSTVIPYKRKSVTYPADKKSITFGTTKAYYTAPARWTVKVEPVKSVQNDSYYFESGLITLTSPDYVLHDAMDGECSAVIISGTTMWIRVYSPVNMDFEKLANDLLNPKDPENSFNKFAVRTKLGGKDAIQSIGTPGECGWNVATETIINNYDFAVSTEADETLPNAPHVKEPYASVYNDLVASIRFE